MFPCHYQNQLSGVFSTQSTRILLWEVEFMFKLYRSKEIINVKVEKFVWQIENQLLYSLL